MYNLQSIHNWRLYIYKISYKTLDLKTCKELQINKESKAIS